MNIKVASEKTGLTKRAIKYYESEGLISPSKNSDNNYREYSEEDIVKLNLISALRLLDISVGDINSVITGNVSIPDIMEKALIRIDDSMQKLEKSTGVKVNMYLDKEAFQKDIEKMALNFVQSLEDEEQVSMLKQLSTLTREKIDVLGQTQVKFGKYLEILSADYKNYIDYIKKYCIGMCEEVKRLTGESMEELLEKHNIKSDY